MILFTVFYFLFKDFVGWVRTLISVFNYAPSVHEVFILLHKCKHIPLSSIYFGSCLFHGSTASNKEYFKNSPLKNVIKYSSKKLYSRETYLILHFYLMQCLHFSDVNKIFSTVHSFLIYTKPLPGILSFYQE